MLTDTITTIENQFFDGLKAVQAPTLDAARKAAELVSQSPVLDSAASQLPSIEAIVTHNFDLVQRLLDTQRGFLVELAGVGTAPRKATAAKKSGA